MPHDESYQRHLPHHIPENVPIFLTWNLKGAVTYEMRDRIAQERQRLEHQPIRDGEVPSVRTLRQNKIVFDFRDRLLGCSSQGPMYLSDPQAAQIVVDSLLFGVPNRYDLFAFVVMANHVHVLLTPRWRLSRVTQGIKGFTAYCINDLQKQKGRTFWQDESFDHWVRDDDEFHRVIHYVESNPVVAQLCEKPEDWPWSSARLRGKWLVGQPFQADFAEPRTSPSLPGSERGESQAEKA